MRIKIKSPIKKGTYKLKQVKRKPKKYKIGEKYQLAKKKTWAKKKTTS